MSSTPVVLYDLPSKKGVAWSLNPWKTRMILNYKKIDYQTEWVEFPDLEPKFKSFGIPPNPKDAPGYYKDYTIPAIKYSDGSYQMDSWPIAHELEKRYPTPSLHLDDPVVVQMRDHLVKIIIPVYPHVAANVSKVMNEPSAEYHLKANKEIIEAGSQNGDKPSASDCWENSREPAKMAGDLIRKNGGPFFLGETVSYADFIFVSMLRSMKHIDEDMFEACLALDPTFPKLYDACKQWLEREN